MTTPAMELADVKKFRFNADVQASDGEAGRLACVVADPATRTVTHVGIRVGWPFGKTHLLPVHLVSDGTAQAVTLSVPLEELEKHADTAPGGVMLTHSTSIVAGGRGLGRLAQMTIHSDLRAIRHLVVARVGGEFLIPGDRITAIAQRQITVDLAGVSPKDLTPYRDDSELYREAYDAIYDYVPLRIDLPGMAIHAIDGVIWLRGYVSSELNKRLAADQLYSIKGLAELYNDLMPDTLLAAKVSAALAHDSRTAGFHLGVYPQLGEIRLRGNVATVAQSQVATQVATGVEGVREVSNEMNVNPHGPSLPDLAAVTGQEDRVPGGS